MQIPAQGSRSLRLQAAATSFANSATLQALVGVNSAEAALASIYREIMDDSGSMPRPRLEIYHARSMTAQRQGVGNWLAKGSMQVFLQVDQLSVAAITEKYSLPNPPTIEDFRADMENLMGQITDDLAVISGGLPMPDGCLEVQAIEELDCGLVQPEMENGDTFFELVWALHFEGQL